MILITVISSVMYCTYMLSNSNSVHAFSLNERLFFQITASLRGTREVEERKNHEG